jgi:hypothetical protein
VVISLSRSVRAAGNGVQEYLRVTGVERKQYSRVSNRHTGTNNSITLAICKLIIYFSICGHLVNPS